MNIAKKIFKLLVIFFIIGFVLAYLMDKGITQLFFLSLGMIPWYLYPLGILFTFYLTLTIHELGHLLSFVFQGVKIRALYLTIFVFVKEGKRFKFKVKPKLWILLGGLVIPDLPKIESKEDYEKTVKIFRNALISAPITTISYMIFSIVLFLIGMIFLDASVILGLIILHMILVVLISSVYIYTFKLHTDSLYGDYVAYHKMKEDPIFTFAQVSQYTEFSTKTSDSEKRFIFDMAKDILKVTPKLNDIMIQHILLYYLDGIIKQDYELDDVVESKIKNIQMHAFVCSEQGLLAFHEIILHDYKIGDIEKAYQKYEEVTKLKRKSINHQFVTYLNHKTAHQIHLSYHQSFLENKHNIFIGDHWIFEPVIDPYQSTLEDLRPLPFLVYECIVDLSE